MLYHVLNESGARAIIFDMDGTLVDNMRFHHRAWLEWAQSEGVQRGSDAQFIAQTHGTVRDIMLRLYPEKPESERRAMGERKEAYYREMYRPHLRLIPGLDEFLRAAQERSVPMAVATAGEQSNIDFTLDGTGSRPYFAAVIGSADVEHGKPHPEVFLKAAQKLGVAPRECLVFEDSTVGAEAARRAGMPCIVVNAIDPREAFERVCGDLSHILHFARDYNDLRFEVLSQ